MCCNSRSEGEESWAEFKVEAHKSQKTESSQLLPFKMKIAVGVFALQSNLTALVMTAVQTITQI